MARKRIPSVALKPVVRNERFKRNMEITFDLYQAAEDMMRQNLRRRNPDATDEEIEEGIRQWLRHRPGAEYGDAEGRPGNRTFEP